MSSKITYLLGAGASANAIPVVAQLHNRINETKEYLKGCLINVRTDRGSKDDFSDILIKIIGNLEWLLDESGKFYTIDTLAKKYYLTDDHTNLVKLKRVLITYFILEQCQIIHCKTKAGNFENCIDVAFDNFAGFQKQPIDKRYGSFLAAITNKTYPQIRNDVAWHPQMIMKVNPNVRVLSWNYDLQFEMTLQEFFKNDIFSLKENFNIYPNANIVNELSRVPDVGNNFSVVKLNGDADITTQELFDSNPKSIIDTFNTNGYPKTIDAFLKLYASSNIGELQEDSCHFLLNFAWESDANFIQKFRGHSINQRIADNIAKQTDILVVIGYSFPIFNREIDARLINSMAKLKKVYIQDRNPERIESVMRGAFSKLQERKPFLTLEIEPDYKISCQHETSLDQFVIPYELDLSKNKPE